MPGEKAVTAKRVYDEPSHSDGERVLVDRLWPRGLKKAKAQVDVWLPEIAPSNELRKWFHAHADEREQFRKRYIEELHGGEASEALARLRELVHDKGKVALLFASKNVDYNNATVLQEILSASKRELRVSRPRKSAAVGPQR
jgi:uncharacterized protein YeaO (DUF488 family)